MVRSVGSWAGCGAVTDTAGVGTAFTITMYEFRATIPTLWDSVKEFMREHPETVARDNAMGYMSDDGGNSYNLCHCAYGSESFRTTVADGPHAVWSNFEIANMDFWRGEAYSKFFDFLDRKGGFYYEVRSYVPRERISPGTRTDVRVIALGRRTGAQYRSRAVPEQGADPLLRRDRVRAQPVHALSEGRGCVGARQVRL